MQNPSHLQITDIISRIHDRKRPRIYLELADQLNGCRYITLADPRTKSYGVNHWPCISIKHPDPNIIIFPVTTDYFFHSPFMFRDLHPDLVLIDGCKKMEIVLKNFSHIEQVMSRDGVILITNTSPSDPEKAIRPKFGDDKESECGDCYRVLSILRSRPDLLIQQVLCEDGLTVITNLDSSNNTIQNNLVYMVRDHLNQPLEEREKCFDITVERFLGIEQNIEQEVQQSIQNTVNEENNSQTKLQQLLRDKPLKDSEFKLNIS